jgi:GntR family transcriptional regulator, transcriptional repressor for pyruvate dehydrogenase complex
LGNREPSLSERTAEQLRAWIIDRAMGEGDKLPPEHELIEQLGISRTVLREAVAGLRARGELTSRRGSGVFVAQANVAPLRISGADIGSVPDMLQDLEIRAAVEIEAASLAARRRNAGHLLAIEATLKAQEAARERPEASAADFAFHRAVADATGNPRFAQFLDSLGFSAIPRSRLHATGQTPEQEAAYHAMLLSEHRAIARAIEQGDATFARDAMRLHLSGSARRYQQAGKEAEPH